MTGRLDNTHYIQYCIYYTCVLITHVTYLGCIHTITQICYEQ